MAGAKSQKTTSVDLEAAQEDREESRHGSEKTEQQALNQGTNTGTHDSSRHGVDWGRAYRTHSKEAQPDEGSKKKKPVAGSNSEKPQDDQE